MFLDLYSYPLDTRNSIIESIQKVKGILWSPHHVFLEYHKNRREVIYKSKKILDEIQNTLGSFASGNSLNVSSISTYKSNYGKFHSELTDSIQAIVDKYTPLYLELQKKLIDDIEPIRNQLNDYKKQDTVSLTGDDPVLNFLANRYGDGDIGQPYQSERLVELFKECDERIINKIPPAFKDSSKSEIFTYRGVKYDSKYGDFIIYKQILDYCLEKKITNVFFISNDVKRDWREPVPHENNKYYGARKELRAEAYTTANIENLILLDLKEYFNVLGITLSKNIVEDIEALKRFHNEKKKKLDAQRAQSIREKLETLKNEPIEILDREIRKSKDAYRYMKELQKSDPDLFNKLAEYQNSRLFNSMRHSKFTNEYVHQVPEGMREAMLAAERMNQVPEGMREAMLAAERMNQVPEGVREAMLAAKHMNQVPEGMREAMLAAERMNQVPEGMREAMLAAKHMNQVPEGMREAMLAAERMNQIPEELRSLEEENILNNMKNWYKPNN
ncbi:PIN-like domain-containing protein (plasmid) [Acinetobacter baumannii]|nr:PIN-like domain-containing protein [Acinetobacter baumannii]